MLKSFVFYSILEFYFGFFQGLLINKFIAIDQILSPFYKQICMKSNFIS